MPLESPAVPKGVLWTGRVISTPIVLFLFFDSVLKFVKPAPVIHAFAHLGIPIHLDYLIGITLSSARSSTRSRQLLSLKPCSLPAIPVVRS